MDREPKPCQVRDAQAADAAAICNIYNHYILNTAVTFEETAVTAAEIASRIESVQAAGLPWLVADEAGEVLGYAYATPWRSRAAYRHSVEVSVYVSRLAHRGGVGSLLYDELFARLRRNDVNAVIGGITLPNPASVAFHERYGMDKVAHFQRVGRKFGEWLDVAYWQCLLRDE